MKSTDMRKTIDKTIQYAASVYWNLICTKEEREGVIAKDQAEKPKK